MQLIQILLLKSTVMPRPGPGAPGPLIVQPLAGFPPVSDGSQRTQPCQATGEATSASQTMQFLSTAMPDTCPQMNSFGFLGHFASTS